MIYFLEDDPSIRKLVIYTLNSQGMEAEGFELPSQFWAAMERQLPSLVLLDLMLPEEDGLHILKRIRAGASTARLPVILITAKGTEYDKVVGLDGGADDYIAKPFGMMELMARIRTALRHSGGEAEPVHALTLGPLRIDPARHQELAHGREVTCSACCWSGEAPYSPGTSCSTPSGAMSSTAPAAQWMSTSAPCVKSWGRRAAASRPCGALATRRNLIRPKVRNSHDI